MLVVPGLQVRPLSRCPNALHVQTAATHLIRTVLCFASSSSALRNFITVLLLESLDESACRVERLSVLMTMVLLRLCCRLQCGCDFS